MVEVLMLFADNSSYLVRSFLASHISLNDIKMFTFSVREITESRQRRLTILTSFRFQLLKCFDVTSWRDNCGVMT